MPSAVRQVQHEQAMLASGTLREGLDAMAELLAHRTAASFTEADLEALRARLTTARGVVGVVDSYARENAQMASDARVPSLHRAIKRMEEDIAKDKAAIAEGRKPVSSKPRDRADLSVNKELTHALLESREVLVGLTAAEAEFKAFLAAHGKERKVPDPIVMGIRASLIRRSGDVAELCERVKALKQERIAVRRATPGAQVPREPEAEPPRKRESRATVQVEIPTVPPLVPSELIDQSKVADEYAEFAFDSEVDPDFLDMATL